LNFRKVIFGAATQFLYIKQNNSVLYYTTNVTSASIIPSMVAMPNNLQENQNQKIKKSLIFYFLHYSV
jgi:hypothetical protein